MSLWVSAVLAMPNSSQRMRTRWPSSDAPRLSKRMLPFCAAVARVHVIADAVACFARFLSGRGAFSSRALVGSIRRASRAACFTAAS